MLRQQTTMRFFWVNKDNNHPPKPYIYLGMNVDYNHLSFYDKYVKSKEFDNITHDQINIDDKIFVVYNMTNKTIEELSFEEFDHDSYDMDKYYVYSTNIQCNFDLHP